MASQRQTYRQWRSEYGIDALLRRRDYLPAAARFQMVVRGLLFNGLLCAEAAKAVERLALAMGRGMYVVVLAERSRNDVEALWYCGEMHSRLRLLAALMGMFAKRARSYKLPQAGVMPVLVRGAEAARERLLAYDPAQMERAPSTDPEMDLRLLLENLVWTGVSEYVDPTLGPITGAAGQTEGGLGIEGRMQGGMG